MVVKNRVFTNVGGESWVPMERWLGRKPPIDMLRVFGCMAMAHIPKAHLRKLGATAVWCVHLGLAAESKGWLMWEPSKGVVFDSRDIKFMEDITYGSWSKQPKEKLMQQLEQITMGFDAEEWVGEEGAMALEEEGAVELLVVKGMKPTVAPKEPHPITRVIPPTLPPRRTQTKSPPTSDAPSPMIASQMRASALKLKSYGGARGEQQQHDALLVLQSSYDSDEEEEEEACCFMAPSPTQPLTMEEALHGPDRDKWLASKDAEYNSRMENGTWVLVPLPMGKKAIQCGWIPNIKTDNKGAMSDYKSRLVARGYQQKEKEDYKETFAATAKPPTLRVLLASAAVCGWVIVQMDITTAFLYGFVDDEVYMTQLPSYEDVTGRLYQLIKAIYGLKQVPRSWYKKLSSVLEEIGFRASACDESLFLMGEPRHVPGVRGRHSLVREQQAGGDEGATGADAKLQVQDLGGGKLLLGNAC
ncbi:unnamed protein product [Closterium sp. NIES-53]